MTMAPCARPSLVLGSSSPRRLDLLRRLGVEPRRVCAPEIDETPLRDEPPRAYALRLARAKAEAVACQPEEVVLAGDTCVALGRRILPPAASPAVQRDLLTRLSGRRHRVWSALCVIDGHGRTHTRLAETIVAFKPLTQSEIIAYIDCGEGLGKAGGYAIQGRAEGWVRFLSGSHSGVIGLPLFEARALLVAANVIGDGQ